MIIPAAPSPIADSTLYSRQRGRASYPRAIAAEAGHLYGWRGRRLGMIDLAAPRTVHLGESYQAIGAFYAHLSTVGREVAILANLLVEPGFQNSTEGDARVQCRVVDDSHAGGSSTTTELNAVAPSILSIVGAGLTEVTIREVARPTGRGFALRPAAAIWTFTPGAGTRDIAVTVSMRMGEGGPARAFPRSLEIYELPLSEV